MWRKTKGISECMLFINDLLRFFAISALGIGAFTAWAELVTSDGRTALITILATFTWAIAFATLKLILRRDSEKIATGMNKLYRQAKWNALKREKKITVIIAFFLSTTLLAIPTYKLPLSKITGLKTPPDWKLKANFRSIVINELPSKFDWRKEVRTIPVVRDQGSCGSCWAFGTTAALNWYLAIRNQWESPLSEQEILSCSRKGSCSGGYFAHDYQVSPGQSLDSEFPYKASNLRCKSGLSHKYKIPKWYYVGDSRRNPTLKELKSVIFTFGPIAVTVTSNSAMQNYKSGIFKGNKCSNGGTNHLVHIVGWDDSENVWIMGNSWSEEWGENGYMRIDYQCSRIAEVASYIDGFDAIDQFEMRKK